MHWIALLGAVLPGLYLLVTSTRYLISGMWPYDAKRIIEFGLLLLLFSLPAVNRSIRAEFGVILGGVPRWIVATAVFAVGWGSVSAFVNAESAMHLANSLSDVVLLTSLVLAVFVVAACRHLSGRWFDQAAIALLTVTGLVVGIQEILGIMAAHALGLQFSYDIALQYFSKPRFYNQFQSWTVPALVALPLLFSSRTRIASGLCVVALGLQWFILLMTAGRGSVVSLAVAFTIMLAVFPSIRKTVLSFQLWGLLLGAMLYLLVLVSFEPEVWLGFRYEDQRESQPSLALAADEASRPSLANGNSSGRFFDQSLGRQMLNTSGRSWMWREALRDAGGSPWFGIGPMNYACVSKFWFGHPHNFPIQLAAEWGFPAALAVIGIVLSAIWNAISRIRSGRGLEGGSQPVAALLLTGVVAAAIHACFSGVLIMPASQVTGILICGTLLGGLSTSLSSRRLSSNDHRNSYLSWLFVPGLLMATFLCVLGIRELETMDKRAEKLPARIISPRIWQDSKVCQLHLDDANQGTNRVNH